ncbi:MAG: FtsX-like permease family protein [Cytophagales bacterium]|nr:FtsX-like permease family protein [Cytophagales bacterium]
MSDLSSQQLPPRWPLKILKAVIKSRFMEEIEGDMEERFHDNCDFLGYNKAKRLYYFDTLKLLRPKLLKGLGGDHQLNHFGMITNHLKVAIRQMNKQKVFSTVKIGGFALGIAACLLISLYVRHQISYDQHYKYGDRIFRVVNQWSQSGEVGYWTNVHGPLKGILEENIPEMELIARTVDWSWGDAGDNHIQVDGGIQSHYEEGFFYADPELLEILEMEMVYGDHTALFAPNTMVLSQRKASIYFPNENPVGKRIVLNNNHESTFTIAGVMEDLPENMHLKGDFILTMFERKDGPGTSGWCCTNYTMYTRLSEGANKELVEQKTGEVRKSLVIDLLKEDGQIHLEEQAMYQSYYFQPVTNIYLNPEEVGDFLSHGSEDLVWIFGIIAVVILLLACINFINLSTASSMSRAREVGLRKAVGSFRSGLMVQYLSESCLYSLFAVAAGMGLATLAMPVFNELTDLQLSLPWNAWWFVPGLFVVSLTLGVLSGIYPALILSGFSTVEALKGKASTGGKSFLQSGMVVFQFAVTVFLIITALALHKQFDFMMNKSLGYEKEQVINLLGLDTMEEEKKQTLKSELLRLPAVKNASLSDFLPVEGSSIHNRDFWMTSKGGNKDRYEAAMWFVDEDYISTLAMEIKVGRDFRKNEPGQSIIINERMATILNLDEPVGQRLTDMFENRYDIIGVVSDFYFEPITGIIRPLALSTGAPSATLSVKVAPQNMDATLMDIAAVWDQFNPNQTMRHRFMDQQFALWYKDIERAKSLFLVFTVLSLVIACSGLFALSLYLIGKKTKEISVRKVLGASLSRLLLILVGDFFKLVLLAIFIAIPVAWYFTEFMIEWMANRITLEWTLFATGAIIASAIAILTVSFEAIRASLVNPAKQLRQE